MTLSREDRAHQLAPSNTIAEISAILRSEGYRAVSMSQVARWLHADAADRRSLPMVEAAVSLAPPTEKELQVDKLIASSRTWRRVQEVLAAALARHPSAARDVAAALRKIEL